MSALRSSSTKSIRVANDMMLAAILFVYLFGCGVILIATHPKRLRYVLGLVGLSVRDDLLRSNRTAEWNDEIAQTLERVLSVEAFTKLLKGEKPKKRRRAA